jgi:hypothetical protein
MRFFFALLLSCSLAAQTTWLTAPSIDAVFVGDDGALRAQAGRRLYVFSISDGAPRVAALLDVPRDADVFDHGADFATATLFEDDPGATPLRAPLLLADGSRLVRRGDALVPEAAAATVAAAPFERARVRRDGFGLSGRTIETVAWPRVFALSQKPGGPWLVGRANRYFLSDAKGDFAPLPPAAIDEESTILDFDASTPPFLADLDGDGVFDFVRVDAGDGAVVVQRRALDRPPPPPEPIVLGGPCPAAEAADVLGDAALELVIVGLPSLSPARRLALLLEGAAPFTWHVFERGAEGLEELPRLSATKSLGVELTVRDGERRARVVPFAAAAREGLLVATPGRRPERVAYSDGAATEFGTALPEGVWRAPLRPVRAFGRVFGVLRSGDRDRLVAF